MAGLNGTSVYQPYATTVTSIGTTPYNGWVKVATLKGADLPSGTGDYAFCVWGNMANISAPRTTPEALIEVGVGDQGGPFPTHVQSLGFKGGATFFPKQAMTWLWSIQRPERAK